MPVWMQMKTNERFSVQALRAKFYERTDQILEDAQKAAVPLWKCPLAAFCQLLPVFLLHLAYLLAHVLYFLAGALATRAQTSKVPVGDLF